MRYALRFLLLTCVLVVSFFPLFAVNDLELIQAIDSGNKLFSRTYKLDETHYLSCITNTLRIYQIADDQLSVVSELVVKDCLSPAHEMVGDKVYAVAEGDGVYVFQVTPGFQIVVLHIIPLIPLGDDFHLSVQVLGTKMVIRNLHYPGPNTDNALYYIDAYDIANELQPVYLGRHWAPENDMIAWVVQSPNGYYLYTFLGAIYYSEDLITLQAPFYLPGFEVGTQCFETSFVQDAKLYFYGYGNSNGFLRQCTINGDNSLSVNWVKNLPGFWFSGIRFEAERVVLLTSNISDNSYATFFSVNGDTWQQTSSISIPTTHQFFPISAGYLGIQYNAVNRFNTDFGGATQIYGSQNMQIEEIILNRYAVMELYEENLFKIFDLQTGTWLDYCTSLDLNRFTNRWNKTELLFCDGYSYQMLSFEGEDEPVLSSFSLDLEPNYCSSSESKWGDRILCLIDWFTNTVIRLYSYENGAVSPLNTWSFPYYSPSVEFYSPDHFYTNQREQGNVYLHFYRINADYSITLVGSIPVDEPYRIYQAHNRIITSGNNNNVIDVSNPDVPILISSVSFLGHTMRNISFNGESHFLFTGISSMAKAQVINSQGEMLTSFYAHLPWYIGENRFVSFNSMHFCIMEHPECVANEDEESIPVPNCLGLPYPNPFRENCHVPVSMKEPGEVKLSVYNLKGQKVKDLESAKLAKGEHLIAWDGKDKNGRKLANGIYLLRLQTREGVYTQRAVLLK